jgi:hypothetical protein
MDEEIENLFNIKDTKQAVKLLSEACEFITKVEDKLYGKVDGETTGELETAYIIIDQVIDFLTEQKED